MPRKKADTHRLSNGLTAQQFRFVLAYANGAPIKEATAKAGYASAQIGYNLLGKQKVQDMVNRIKSGELESGESDMTRRDVIEELKAIAFSDVRDMLQVAMIRDADGNPIETFLPANPKEWTDETAAAVARIKFHPSDKGGNVSEIALWPKMDALKQLAVLSGDDALRDLPHQAQASIKRFERAKDITPTPADIQSAEIEPEPSDTADDGEACD